MVWILLILMPLTLFGQYRFGPLRLDDGTAVSYANAHVTAEPSGDLLVTWAEEYSGGFAAFGQRLTPAGQLIGERVAYAHLDTGVVTCHANPVVLRKLDGHEARLMDHG